MKPTSLRPLRILALSLAGLVVPTASVHAAGPRDDDEPAGKSRAAATKVEPATATKEEEAARKKAPSFLRLVYTEDGMPIRLQTAWARYVPASSEEGEESVMVDLIAAIHVADRSYYKDLEEQFEGYDALLFELIKPDWVDVPDGTPEPALDPISAILDLGLDFVDLTSQTDHIDYTRKNFVHADLTPEGMLEAMRKRGDDLLTVALSAVADVMREENLRRDEERRAQETGEAKENPYASIDLLGLLTEPDPAMQLKRVFATQLATSTDQPMLGPTLERLIIADRNEACVRVLTREIARGKKKLAIFYGAAHMADFDRRLREDFGLKRASMHWHTAWDLR